jgi:hypothetical protein
LSAAVALISSCSKARYRPSECHVSSACAAYLSPDFNRKIWLFGDGNARGAEQLVPQKISASVIPFNAFLVDESFNVFNIKVDFPF